MYQFNIKVLELPEPDILDIQGLIRWDLDFCRHFDLIEAFQEIDAQVYLIDGTIYGCFVKAEGVEYLFTWFGFYKKNADDIIFPESSIDLQDILENCDEFKVEGLLYNLDILAGSNTTII